MSETIKKTRRSLVSSLTDELVNFDLNYLLSFSSNEKKLDEKKLELLIKKMDSLFVEIKKCSQYDYDINFINNNKFDTIFLKFFCICEKIKNEKLKEEYLKCIKAFAHNYIYIVSIFIKKENIYFCYSNDSKDKKVEKIEFREHFLDELNNNVREIFKNKTLESIVSFIEDNNSEKFKILLEKRHNIMVELYNEKMSFFGIDIPNFDSKIFLKKLSKLEEEMEEKNKNFIRTTR